MQSWCSPGGPTLARTLLSTQEDKDTFCNAVRNEVKGAGILDTADNCWDFFIDKVRSGQRAMHGRRAHSMMAYRW